jgi:hypothetical protein
MSRPKNQILKGGDQRRLGYMVRSSAKRIFIRLGKQARHYVVEFHRQEDIPRIGDSVKIGTQEWTVFRVEDTEILARILRPPDSPRADHPPQPSADANIQTKKKHL